MKQVELGDEVKCKITGYRGIVTSIAKCITGCDRATVQPPVNKKGEIPTSHWLDLDALEILHKVKVPPQEVTNAKKPGGPPTVSNVKG